MPRLLLHRCLSSSRQDANVVHYVAQLTADGKLDPNEPVTAYWVMLAEDGRRKKLNWIEKRKAYGFTIKHGVSASSYIMTLVAYPELQITVKQENDSVLAETVINGRPAVLGKMFINASEGLFGPTVLSIEVYGKDLQTGEMLREKLVPGIIIFVPSSFVRFPLKVTQIKKCEWCAVDEEVKNL